MTDLVSQKSSHSGQDQDCVEVADLPRGAAVRDSKNPTKGHLPFPSSEWAGFLAAALTRWPGTQQGPARASHCWLRPRKGGRTRRDQPPSRILPPVLHSRLTPGAPQVCPPRPGIRRWWRQGQDHHRSGPFRFSGAAPGGWR